MAPRRGETTEDRREGEVAEWGERISNVEVKVSNIEVKISDIDAKISRLETAVEANSGEVTKAIQQLAETVAKLQNQIGKGKEISPNPNPEKSPMEEGDRWVGDGGMVGQGGRSQEREPRPAAPWVGSGQGTVGQQRPILGWTGSTIRGGPEGIYAGQHGRPARGQPRPTTP